MTWRDEAACIGKPLDLFFPEIGRGCETAKKICRQCPVQLECLEDALAVHAQDDHGVRGGLSAVERSRLRSQLVVKVRRPVRCGFESGYRTHLRRGEEPCGPCREASRAARRERV